MLICVGTGILNNAVNPSWWLDGRDATLGAFTDSRVDTHNGEF